MKTENKQTVLESLNKVENARKQAVENAIANPGLTLDEKFYIVCSHGEHHHC
jgi:hypothetical protein